MRLCTAIQYGGAKALQKLWSKAHFLNNQQVPADNPPLLYKRLKMVGNPNGTQRNKCYVEKLLNKDEVRQVFPANQQTHIDQWDISLSIKLLKHVTQFGQNINTNRDPLDMDGEIPTGHQGHSVADFIDYLRRCRNFIIHYPPVDLTEDEFERYWNMLVWILQGLGYEADNIADLKTGNLQTDIEKKSLTSLQVASSTNIRILKSRMQRDMTLESEVTGFERYQNESLELKSLQEQMWTKNPTRAIELMTEQKLQLQEEIFRQQSTVDLSHAL